MPWSIIKDTLGVSRSSILIWLYPLKASMKLNSSCPAVTSMSISILGKGKQSLGHASLRSVKSMHIFHFPWDLGTITGFASHSGYWISCMNLASNNLSTSALMASYLFGAKPLFFCLTGFLLGSTLNWCVMTWGSISGMSTAVQAKTSLLFLRNWMRSPLISSLSPDPM